MRASKTSILEYLQEIKPLLQSKGIIFLALFGSFARDEANPYSDIDVAIQKEQNYMQAHSAYEYFDLIEQLKTLLRKKFHRNSDVFDLDSDSFAKNTVLKEMIRV